jgi:predicted PurR-regulated permease PerM
MDFDPGKWCSEHKGMLILVLAALILIFYFFFPFLDGIILGTVFAYVGKPIRDNFGKRKRLGPLVAAVCIVVPIFFVLGLGMIEIANQILILAKNQEAIRTALSILTEQTSRDLAPWMKDLLTSVLENAASIIAPIAASIPVFHIGRVASLGIINFVVSIPVCYFVLVDGESFVESIISLLPQREKEAYRKYMSRIDYILSGIFIGTIYTSILGSIIAAFIFYAFGLHCLRGWNGALPHLLGGHRPGDSLPVFRCGNARRGRFLPCVFRSNLPAFGALNPAIPGSG